MKVLRRIVWLWLILLPACGGKKTVEGWKPPESWWQVPDDVYSFASIDKEHRVDESILNPIIKREGDNLTIEDPDALKWILITEPYAGWYRTRSAFDPEIKKKEFLVVWFGEDELRDIEEILKEKIHEGFVRRWKVGSMEPSKTYGFYWKIENKYMWMSKDGKVWYRALIGASNKDGEYFYLRCDPLGIEGYFAPSESPEEEFRKQKASK